MQDGELGTVLLKNLRKKLDLRTHLELKWKLNFSVQLRRTFIYQILMLC